MSEHEYMREEVQMLRPIPQFRVVKYLAGHKYEKRLEQLYINDKAEQVWRAVPELLETDLYN